MRRPARSALALILAAFAIGPLLLLVVQSFARTWWFPALAPSSLETSAWTRALRPGPLLESLGVSTVIAVATALGALMIAMPVALLVARLEGKWRSVAAAAAFLPVAAPPVAVGAGLQIVMLAVGLGGTAAGVVLAHLVPATGYLSLFFIGVFAVRDWRAEEAARTLGATALETWRLVTLPLMRRQILEAAALGFLVSWAQFALTLIVGAGAVRTLPLAVYSLARAGQSQAAAVGSLLLIVPPLAGLALLGWAARRTTVIAA